MAPELGVEALEGFIIILVLVSYLDSHMTGTLRTGALPLGSSCELLQVALDSGFDQTLPPVVLPWPPSCCITLLDESHRIYTDVASEIQNIPFSHPTRLLTLQCEFFHSPAHSQRPSPHFIPLPSSLLTCMAKLPG